MTRLCHTKTIVTVNGQFPGPRIVAREGDRVVVKVVNHVQNNVSLHWYARLSRKFVICRMVTTMCLACLTTKIWLVINMFMNRHGVRQLRSGWADGPAYVTQCPIQTGHTYVYNFTIVGQRGTLFWHAHISWLRSTLYGPIVILPKKNVPYPFEKPYKEATIIFGTQPHYLTKLV